MMGSTFGATLSATSSTTLVMDVSADRKAFTGTFGDFQVEANNTAAGSAPIAARWEWFVLPVADTPQGDSISISVSGNVVTEDAARGTLVISVNGQVTVTGFPPSSDEGFVQSIHYVTSGFDTEFQLVIGVVVEGDSQACSAASVTVSAVDAEVGLDAPKPGDVEPATSPA
jgi:hypothetical protein